MSKGSGRLMLAAAMALSAVFGAAGAANAAQDTPRLSYYACKANYHSAKPFTEANEATMLVSDVLATALPPEEVKKQWRAAAEAMPNNLIEGWADCDAFSNQNEAAARRAELLADRHYWHGGTEAYSGFQVQKPTPPKLHMATLAFLEGSKTQDRSGYQSAYVKLRYGFVACDGGIYMAYGLEPSSLSTSRFYLVKGQRISAPRSKRPMLESVAFTGKVQTTPEAGIILSFTVGDRFAGKALGYGCYDGQIRKIGSIAQVAGPVLGPHPKPQQLRAFLDRELILADAVIAEPLRNGALENPPAAARHGRD